MKEWQPIETVPVGLAVLCAVLPPRIEAEVHQAVFGEEPPIYLRLVLAHQRKGDPKQKVRELVNGRIWVATHWMELPDPPLLEGIVE